MKITLAELLQMIKEDKQPKKIKYDGDIYLWENYKHYYAKDKSFERTLDFGDLSLLFLAETKLFEIIEEQEEFKEIEELKVLGTFTKNQKKIGKKINGLILAINKINKYIADKEK